MAASRRDLRNAILRQSLSAFVGRVFSILCPGAEYVPGWHIDAITYALMQVNQGEIRRLVITMPPRSLKSIITSVIYPAWLLHQSPPRRRSIRSRWSILSFGQHLSG